MFSVMTLYISHPLLVLVGCESTFFQKKTNSCTESSATSDSCWSLMEWNRIHVSWASLLTATVTTEPMLFTTIHCHH